MTSERKIGLPFQDSEFIKLCQELDISYIGMFGSTSRGQEGSDSDLDLLVRFSEPKSLLDLVGAEQALEDFLGRQVDLVTEGGLHPHIRQRITEDLLDVYGAR